MKKLLWLMIGGLALASSNAQTTSTAGMGTASASYTGGGTSPISVTVNSFIPEAVVPIPVLGGNTHGDGRDFGQSGTSRLSQTVWVFPNGNTQSPGIAHIQATAPVIGLSVREKADGSTISGYASTANMHVTATSMGSLATIRIYGAASNPTVDGAPDVDYDITIKVNVATMSAEIQWDTDQYPNYEVKLNNVLKLKLVGKNPWYLYPALPNHQGSSSVSIGAIPYFNPIVTFPTQDTFLQQVPSGVIMIERWNFGGTIPKTSVKLGDLIFLDFIDPNTGQTYTE